MVLGTAIAYIVLRTQLPGRQLLDRLVTVALAMPGLVLGIGYLRTFAGVELPFGGGALTASWLIVVLAYAVRRLPYALRSCMAALQQVHVVARGGGARTSAPSRWRTIRRIVVPLMMGGILAGFVTSFITAAVEISETILLTSRESMAPHVLRHLPLHAVASPGAVPAPRSASSPWSLVALRHLPLAPSRRGQRRRTSHPEASK